MKKLLFCALLFPLFATAQGNIKNFGRFSIEGGFWLKGTSQDKNYPNYFIVTDLVASSTNNNTRVDLTVPVSMSTNSFTNSATKGTKLPAGEIVVVSISQGQQVVQYKIYMENIAVVEATRTDAGLKLVLDATRIGWTNFEYNSKGTNTGTSKSGWDKEKGVPWTAF